VRRGKCGAHTIAYRVETLQIVLGRGDRSLSAKSVEVHVTPEGSIYLYDGRPRLGHRVVNADARPSKQGGTVKESEVKKEADPSEGTQLSGFCIQ
jgi:hypothetical protein